jgi:hypothetical protein
MASVTDVPDPSGQPVAGIEERNRRPGGYTSTKDFGRELNWGEWFRSPQYAQQAVFEPAEVAALLKYASEQGIDTEDHLLTRLYQALHEYNKNPKSELAIVSEDGRRSMPYAEVILSQYSRLTKLTEGINGRNLLHGRHLVRETLFFLLVTLVIFGTSISALAYGAWIADQTPADDPFLPLWAAHAIQYFAPFAWGALGSCVYILKRISDEAAANRFDPDRFQGWQTRALLGAVLGGTITYVIDPTAFTSAQLNDTAIAFLAGLGTKIVYGGFERMIALLAEKLNLDAVAKAKLKPSAIAEFLAKEVSNTDPTTQPEKYKVLVELLQSREQPS